MRVTLDASHPGPSTSGYEASATCTEGEHVDETGELPPGESLWTCHSSTYTCLPIEFPDMERQQPGPDNGPFTERCHHQLFHRLLRTHVRHQSIPKKGDPGKERKNCFYSSPLKDRHITMRSYHLGCPCLLTFLPKLQRLPLPP